MQINRNWLNFEEEIFKKKKEWRIKDIWEDVKISNIHGLDFQEKKREQRKKVFKAIMSEDLLKLMNDIYPQFLEQQNLSKNITTE